MNPRLAPFLRVGGLAVLVLMLLYLPTREFSFSIPAIVFKTLSASWWP
jgi:hypothetical protein